METDNPAERFKNGMKMQLCGRIAIFEVPKRKRNKRTSHTLTLSREDEHSCIIDWRLVDPTWETSRLRHVVLGGVEGMLEDDVKFWKLCSEYSPGEVARRMMEQGPHSPVPALEDHVAASAQEPASAYLGHTQASEASNHAAQRGGGPRQWPAEGSQRGGGPRQWLAEGVAQAGSQASTFCSAAPDEDTQAPAAKKRRSPPEQVPIEARSKSCGPSTRPQPQSAASNTSAALTEQAHSYRGRPSEWPFPDSHDSRLFDV